ncbi:MAG: hypothetical protein FJ030_11300 [Chloroflexi bacterium]|nr:hypothetical protein [Chloroflexota bacterium]
MLTPYPSPFTASAPSQIIIGQWIWKEVPPEKAAALSEMADRDMDRVGKIYEALADEDAALAEMGMDEYARLLDHDLKNAA